MTIGFRILRRVRKVDAGAVAKFKALPLANVSDVMSRMSAGGPRLRPMHGKGALAGPALTVKTRPGDNLMVQKTLRLAIPAQIGSDRSQSTENTQQHQSAIPPKSDHPW